MTTANKPVRSFVRPFLPDTSGGYTSPVEWCTSRYSIPIAVAGDASSLIECVMSKGHAGSHRNNGVHWSSPEEAPEAEVGSG